MHIDKLHHLFLLVNCAHNFNSNMSCLSRSLDGSNVLLLLLFEIIIYWNRSTFSGMRVNTNECTEFSTIACAWKIDINLWCCLHFTHFYPGEPVASAAYSSIYHLHDRHKKIRLCCFVFSMLLSITTMQFGEFAFVEMKLTQQRLEWSIWI